MEVNNKQTDHNNAELAYNYTKEKLEDINKGLDRINDRLTNTLAASAIILGLSTKLDDSSLFLAITKVIACFLLVGVLSLCLYAVRPKATGKDVDPQDLLETNWFYEQEWYCKLYIARAWKKSINLLEDVYNEKSKLLQHAQILLVLTGLVVLSNIVLKTIITYI